MDQKEKPKYTPSNEERMERLRNEVLTGIDYADDDLVDTILARLKTNIEFLKLQNRKLAVKLKKNVEFLKIEKKSKYKKLYKKYKSSK